MSRKILLGTFGVDSGQVLICDPCYLDHWKSDEMGDAEKDPGEGNRPFSYSGACLATLSEKGGGQVGYGYDGVASSTGYGDGTYPVYAVKNSEGRIVRLVVEFDEAEEEGES